MNRKIKRRMFCAFLAFSIVLSPMPADRVYAAEHVVVQSVSESLVIEKAGAGKKGTVRQVVVPEIGSECVIRWDKPKGKRRVEGYKVIVRSGDRAYNDHVFTGERSYSFDEELKAGTRIKVYIRPYYRDDRKGKRLSFTFSVRKKSQVYTTESPEVLNVYAYAEIFKNMTVTREDILEKANESSVPEAEIECIEDRIRYMGASWAVEEQKNKDKEDAEVKYGIRNFDRLLNTFAENEKLNSTDDN